MVGLLVFACWQIKQRDFPSDVGLGRLDNHTFVEYTLRGRWQRRFLFWMGFLVMIFKRRQKLERFLAYRACEHWLVVMYLQVLVEHQLSLESASALIASERFQPIVQFFVSY
jgi:hypothetical protein